MDKTIVIAAIVLTGIAGYFFGNATANQTCKENIERAVKMNQALRAQLAFKDCD